MKLRNKKTGEIASKIDVSQDGESIWVFGRKPECYRSLAELNEEWEDAEDINVPIIKDEKIRKLVRAWAEYNSIEKVRYSTALKSCDLMCIGGYDFMIELVGLIPTLRDDETYTIAELCGEEEE